MALRSIANELCALRLGARASFVAQPSASHSAHQDASCSSSSARQFHADTASASVKPTRPVYDDGSDHKKVDGAAPFVPPSIQKLINVMIRHGQKEIAQKTVFKTSHILYNMSRQANPRPNLKQRNPKFVPVELK